MLKLNIQRFAGEDGSVVIKVKADTKQFDKDMVSLQKRLNELSEKANQSTYEIDGVKVNDANSQIVNLTEEEAKEYNELIEKLGIVKQEEEEIFNNEMEIWQKSQDITEEKQKQNNENKIQISESAQLLANIRGMLDNYNLIKKKDIIDNKDIEDVQQLKDEIIKTAKEYEKITGKKLTIPGITDIKNETNQIGVGLSNITKKVVKWGLAIFSIRSIYTGIRQAVNQIMQEDENLKWQVEYMKFALGQAIKPVVEWIVNLVHQILVGVGAIIKILFGINIFANATASNFKKANTNAKKLQKTLTGFDEMNILNEDGSTGNAGAISNALKGFGDIAKQVDELAEKLKPFEDEIKAAGLLALGIFGATTIGKWLSNLGTFMGSKGLGKLGSVLGKLGIIAGGIAITAIIAAKVWQEAQELKNKLIELREIGAKGQEEYIKNEDDINRLINTGNANRSAGNKLLENSEAWMHQIFGWSKEEVKQAEQTAINIGKQIDKEIELYNKKVEENGENEETIALQKAIKNNIIEQYQYNLKVIDKLKEQGLETSGIEEQNKHLIQNYKDMGGNVEDVKNELGEVNGIKFDDKELNIKFDADTKEAERKTNSWLDNLWNGIQGIGKALASTTPIGGAINVFSSVGSGISSLWKKLWGAKGMIYTPRLARGGIINQPGRGVPLGSAFGGERGMEGVIPLTDSQQMELLGATIGKYISINATVPVYVGNRQIAREIRKIDAENDFAYNR